jgi:hypothetical protein
VIRLDRNKCCTVSAHALLGRPCVSEREHSRRAYAGRTARYEHILIFEAAIADCHAHTSFLRFAVSS